ncbi:uncharacterized protein LOC127801748 [Diospyros lotus]|uniref:uncharacterized protein LOC127801748 n=1 Tax=Diospyros lotus TaxID=55363 RepID=UPI002254EC51|nr:uncharacterized protein LOC127801748 [Diospyros lotus]
MHYYRRRSSISDGFFLSPLPYPALVVLAVILLLLSIQWYASYESVVEATEESMGWALLAVPLLLLLVVKWLSTLENPERLFCKSPYDRRRTAQCCGPSEGSSPWGVAAVILLVLLLLQFQSTFLDSWFF